MRLSAALLLSVALLSACASDPDSDLPFTGASDSSSAADSSDTPADTGLPPEPDAQDSGTDDTLQPDTLSDTSAEGSGSGDTDLADVTDDTADTAVEGSGSGDTDLADVTDDTADAVDADTSDTTDTDPGDAADTADTTPPRVWVFPCDAGCPTGLTCDETGYCRRSVVPETYAEGSGDPTSGARLSNLTPPDPASSTPDVAPLDCNGTGRCVAPFTCNLDGSCTAPCTACGGDCDYESLTYAAATHIQSDLLYAGTPAGGNHHLCWAPWGISATPVGDEHWVHNLEHGGVAFLYRCVADCSAEVAQLGDYVSTLPAGTAVMSPEPMLNHRFTVVSWGYRLETDCLDLAAFEAFFVEHQGHGPESTTMPPPPQCL